MKTKVVFLTLILISLSAHAESIPSGYTKEDLRPLGGEILVPESWYFRGGATNNGFMYVLSKEQNEDDSYETGFRIQGIINIKDSGLSPVQATAYNWKRFKDSAKEIIKECDEEQAGVFRKTCLEVIQNNPNNPDDDFHIIYSFFWSDELDMIVIGIFGAPESTWPEAENIYNTIKDFVLFDIDKMEFEEDEPQP